MPTGAELYLALLKRSGISNEALTNAINTNEELKKVEVPTADYNVVLTNLMNVEQAKSNPSLISYFRADNLDPIDNTINSVVDELGEDGAVVKSEKSTFKKLSIAFEALRKAEAKKHSANAPDKKAMQEKIDELNTQIKNILKEKDDEINSIRSQNEASLTGLTIKSMLNGYQYGLQVDHSVAMKTANAMLESELASKGLKIVRDGDNLVIKDKNNLDYTVNNEKVEFGKFVESVVSPILKKHDDPVITQPQQPYQNPQSPNPKVHYDYSDIKQAREALKAGTTAPAQV
jgi:hypothetical protein